ncbi:MAG: glycosyltransferase family 4 protein [Candidatus Marinimicrobia bacterium]|nr:glycosyltransferase family 4 protein [Candidatus Neomarinimicrobiota bacterium]
MNLFVIPSWYPSEIYPHSGTFFEQQAKILKNYVDNLVVISSLIYSPKEFSISKLRKFKKGLFVENGLNVIREEKFPPLPKIQRMYYYSNKTSIIKMLKKALTEFGKPDFIISYSSIWSGASVVDYCIKNKVPIFISEHLKEFLLDNGFSKFQKNLIKKTYQFVDKIIVPSSAMKKSILKKFHQDREKVTVIPNPVDEAFLTAEIVHKKDISEFKFVTVSLFRPEKRINWLIKAFKELVRERQNLRLVIIGDGPEKNNIFRLINKLNVKKFITLTGYLSKEEIIKILQKCHAYIQTSRVETFGMSIVEAMALGLPVISTKCGGPEDFINKNNGILVDINNYKNLIDAMLRIIYDYNKYNPETIRNYIIKNFNSEIFARSILSLYR